MSVRKRRQTYANGRISERWIVDVEFRRADGSIARVRRVPRTQSRVGAERLEREILADLERQQSAQYEKPIDVPELSAFWQTFYNTHVVVNNKPSEQATKKRIMSVHLLPAFGAVKLDAIDAHAIEVYKAKLVKRSYQHKTINNHQTLLRTMLNAAIRWKMLGRAPTIKLLRLPLRDVDFLNFEEARRLEQASANVWQRMVRFVLNTGLRIGEVLALRWQDIDLQGHRVRVCRNLWAGIEGTPKSGRAREIPLNSCARTALGMPSYDMATRVFCHDDGTSLTYRESHYALERICKNAVMRPVQWHCLRHTFASHLVIRGVPMRAVQELLGHSTQSMTDRYVHLTPDVRRQAVEVLEATFEATFEATASCIGHGNKAKKTDTLA